MFKYDHYYRSKIKDSFGFLVIIFLCYCLAESNVRANEEKSFLLCPDLRVKGEIDPSFTDIEKRLTCGYDKKENNYTDPAWETIPFNQAKYNISNFLQDRGYHHPVFGYEGKLKWVQVGEKTRVRSFKVEGVEDVIEIQRKRKIIGETLTPALLEGLEKWVSERLQAKGYGCPKVKSVASGETGDIVIQVEPGEVQSLIGVSEEPVPSLLNGAFHRYHAFGLNEPFDGDLLNITRGRIGSRGIVESNHFSFTCDAKGVSAHHMLVPGAPRILSFGAGIDTEGIVRSKASWKNARLGRLGSLLDLTAMGSFRTQSLSTTSDWYFLPEVSRKYISSTVELKHENQPQYHTLSVIGQVGFATTFDSRTAGGSLFVGPSMNFVRDYSLAGPYNAKFLFLESRLAIRSHDFEYFASNPNTGYNLNFIADLSHPEVLTDTSAQRFNVNGEFLWNLKNYDPPLAVFAVRAGFGTLFVSDSPFSSRLLPGNFYQYLGGSVDLRGFSLKELPRNQSSGARTSGFAGFEARLANTIPYGIEPFAFFDIGALGDQPMSFDLPIYTSPGIGVRWKTPIGTFRTTLAHGFSGDSQKDHWQPYLSFGEEF